MNGNNEMDNQRRRDLLRIGALMQNSIDSTSAKLTIKKIIDFCFATLKKTSLSTSDITNFLSSDAGTLMDFTDDEIIECCKQYDTAYIVERSAEVSKITIQDSYLKSLIEKMPKANFDSLFSRFYNQALSEKQKAKYSLNRVGEMLYKYLYILLIEGKIDSDKIIKGEIKYIPTQIESDSIPVINEFTEWEDEDKVKVVDSIYLSGIEFSLLTVKKSLVTEDLLSKIVIYLDTNVVYRLLGLNGSELKRKAEQCIGKFHKLHTELRISFITKKELFDTLSQKMEFIASQLTNTKTYTISSLFEEDESNYNVFQFFIDWRKKTRLRK
jgi:hypothetical protein